MSVRFFQKVNMASETVASLNKTGLYQVSGTNAVAYPGYFVRATGLASNPTYGNKDLNKLTVEAPAAVTDKGIFVVDLVKVQDGSINNNTYRIGAQTIGLSAAAGEAVALRQIEHLNEQFLLGDGNFQSAPTVGQYAILTAADPDLSPSATIPASGFTVAIDAQLTISQGVTGNVTAYLCRVVQL